MTAAMVHSSKLPAELKKLVRSVTSTQPRLVEIDFLSGPTTLRMNPDDVEGDFRPTASLGKLLCQRLERWGFGHVNHTIVEEFSGPAAFCFTFYRQRPSRVRIAIGNLGEFCPASSGYAANFTKAEISELVAISLQTQPTRAEPTAPGEPLPHDHSPVLVAHVDPDQGLHIRDRALFREYTTRSWSSFFKRP